MSVRRDWVTGKIILVPDYVTGKPTWDDYVEASQISLAEDREQVENSGTSPWRFSTGDDE